MATITIGRSPQNTIVVDSSYSTVSSNHATITDNGGTLTLQDHSTNGTYVNGQHVHNQSISIRQGDKITLASTYELPWREVMRYFGGEHATQRYPQTPQTMRDEPRQQPQVAQQININIGGGAAKDEPDAASYRETPQCLGKWNWGAFLLGWIWAVGNGVWWGLLGLIPYVGFIINIILGINGNNSAWEKFSGSADEFDEKQHQWAKAGWIIFVIILIVSFFVGVASAL